MDLVFSQELKSLLKVSPSEPVPYFSNGPRSLENPRRRRITFNELVHSLDDDEESEWHKLKSGDVTPTQEGSQVCCFDFYHIVDILG